MKKVFPDSVVHARIGPQFVVSIKHCVPGYPTVVEVDNRYLYRKNPFHRCEPNWKKFNAGKLVVVKALEALKASLQ